MLQNRSQLQVAGTPNDVQRSLLILHARKIHHHGVALANDLGLGHADGIHSRTNDLHGDVESQCVVLTLRLQGDGSAALQVEPQ